MWFGRFTLYQKPFFFVYSCHICIISQQMECLPEIVNETGKSTNMPYLRGGECPLREVLKEISQSKIF